LLSLARIGLTERRDPFGAAASTKFAGRRFRIAQYVKSSDANDNSVDGTWRYDRDGSQIQFHADGNQWHVMYRSNPAGSYVGRNAFGVKVKVQAYRAIEVIVDPQGGSVMPDGYRGFDLGVAADPERGRALSKSAVYVVEGELVATDGQLVSCNTNDDNATFDDPIEEVTTTCSIKAKIDGVALLDATTGIELKKWSLGTKGP
jgi:hypothetical protein